ncbi:MAG: NrfD/PsrC family molybdoenzyme membrane anchor subunit [Dehalobacterium sp.]
MSHNHNSWGWMLALDFFFAGMGAGMLVIAGIADLFFDAGKTSLLSNAIAPGFIAFGAGLLIFELGRPFQAWRVFVNFKALLTVGAWNMSLCIVFGMIFASFGIGILPWSGWVALRKILAVLCVIVGLVVATYPGILLARYKARPLWNGPGMLALFLLSSLATGIAAHIVGGLIFPAVSPVLLDKLPMLLAALLLLQFILWLGYLWIKITGTTEQEAQAARRWTKGSYAVPFKIGFMLFGTLIPLILFLFSSPIADAIAASLVIFGGLIMRNLVIYSGQDRTGAPAILGPVLVNVRID